MTKNNKEVKHSIELGGREMTLSMGKLAEQADGAVLAQYGETVVLATVVASPLIEDRGYFPLSVEYVERLYAGGKIKGSRWVKREGKPSDEDILKARLIDRSIRPLFPDDFAYDVQVIITVLSVDIESDPGMVAPIAASAAIAASRIPWEGPVGVVSVGMKDGVYFTNPRISEEEHSEMDLVVSSTKNAIVMIEAGAKEVAEKEILDGIEYAQKENEKIVKFIEKFAKEINPTKLKVEKKESNEELKKQIEKEYGPELEKLGQAIATKQAKWLDLDELKAQIVEKFAKDEEDNSKEIGQMAEKIFKSKIRENILKGQRPDGRKLDEIRSLSSEVGVLPRTHGSAIFSRGSTQALTVTTLASPALGLLIETAEGEEEKHYIHHYSMPPYTTGETGRIGSPSRREIGHGALAERALQPVIPHESVFPYTIRVVSEIMSSNGSTSMASTCGSTLSLMDAGVPIKAPVAGIAMGLVIKDSKNYAVLTDIAGIEDFNGDMDFKVAGTENGVTALQLDVKTLNLSLEILKDAINHATKGRKVILDSMLKTLKEPRSQVSNYAPKITSIQIDPEKIGEVIGSGGKTIKMIAAKTDAEIDIDDDGTVNITAMTEEGVEKAKVIIENLVKEVQIGEIYEGEVKRIQQFGVFVEFLPGKEGLVRIGDMAEEFVQKPEDIVSLGDKVQVRIKEIDDMHRVNLSMILDPSKDKKPHSENGGRGGRRDNRGIIRRDNRGGGRRDSRSSGRRDNRSGSRSSGPHFPASRLVDTSKGDRNRR